FGARGTHGERHADTEWGKKEILACTRACQPIKQAQRKIGAMGDGGFHGHILYAYPKSNAEIRIKPKSRRDMDLIRISDFFGFRVLVFGFSYSWIAAWRSTSTISCLPCVP